MEAELTSDLRLTAAAVLRMQWGQHKEQPKAPPARTARRDRVPPGVISPEQGEEEQGAEEEEASATCADSEDSSDEQDGTTRTPLSEDSHQHGLMLAAFREVGNDYAVDNGQLTKGLEALQSFESVPRRWPLARLTVPLLKCVEYLDGVLAGCCWEVLITTKDPDDSLGALGQAAKSLTLTLASYLSEFVAETLRASRTPQGGPQTDKENVHLLGANFWVQPIYQELLHAASGHNASVDGERKRPCSGLVKIVAKQRRAKTRAPAVDTACVSDWIGGFCPADSLMIWFPAHWAPQVIRELESREQDFRQMFTQWFDEQFPAKYRKQYQDARDSRTLHFQNRQYLKSSIKLLTALIRVDWFSLPMAKFLDRMPQLRQGLIRGVFQTKASSPWAGNKSQSIQISPCACLTKEILIHGTRRCLHGRLYGRILQILILTTSRRPLLISFFLFACRWGCPS